MDIYGGIISGNAYHQPRRGGFFKSEIGYQRYPFSAKALQHDINVLTGQAAERGAKLVVEFVSNW